MGVVKTLIKKSMLNLGEMELHKGGGKINWFPGHMASATRAIRDRLKLSDLVIEVRDARIPLSSMNQDLQPALAGKRRIVALNKKDLANHNLTKKWKGYFDSCKQECLAINAHNRNSVQKLLDVSEFKLREVISREPTLLIMVVGVPNVGKSALINQISQIASSRFPAQGKKKKKRATVGPLPGVTQDIAGFKIAHQPSIYVLDTPGVLVPSISDIEIGLKLALTGSVKDSVVGEERIAEYLLAVLNTRGIPLQWKRMLSTTPEGGHTEYGPDYKLANLLPQSRPTLDKSDVHYVEDMVTRVQRALCSSLLEFDGSVQNEDDLECLIYKQFEVLQIALKIPHKASEARLMVAKRFLTLFRTGKLGTFILDDVPGTL